MTKAKNDYLVQRGQQIERKKRIVTYIGLVSFGGSMLFGGLNFLQQTWQKPQQAVVKSAETDLQQQIKGYELVLQREPNNQTALEKLSILRLNLGDNQGAIALIEKLVELHPDRQDYQTALTNIKQKKGK
ncbi:MAG: tetratricopeptide repeat protein [Dolichospermum sp.]|jgi:tetratricopeptide (TPR) repeat protein